MFSTVAKVTFGALTVISSYPFIPSNSDIFRRNEKAAHGLQGMGEATTFD